MCQRRSRGKPCREFLYLPPQAKIETEGEEQGKRENVEKEEKENKRGEREGYMRQRKKHFLVFKIALFCVGMRTCIT